MLLSIGRLIAWNFFDEKYNIHSKTCISCKILSANCHKFSSDLYAQNISTTWKSNSVLWMLDLCFDCWKVADSVDLGDT